MYGFISSGNSQTNLNKPFSTFLKKVNFFCKVLLIIIKVSFAFCTGYKNFKKKDSAKKSRFFFVKSKILQLLFLNNHPAKWHKIVYIPVLVKGFCHYYK